MPRDDSVPPAAPSGLVVLACAVACGAGAANLYYAQPLTGLIGPELGLSPSAVTLIVTLTQIGYAAGLFLLVPLGDLLENRRLIAITMGTASVALVAASQARGGAMFLAASLLVGLSSAAVQMLVPFVASLAPLAIRGRVVGTVMSGLLLGILLARPVSSLVTDAFGWRSVFLASAVAIAGIAVVLRVVLPRRVPLGGLGYRRLLGSLWPLLRDTPVLRRRTLYQSAMFASFALFWTAAPLLLAAPPFRLSQTGMALFALAGAGGASAAPIAGRLADAGWSRAGSAAAIGLATLAFVLSSIGAASGSLWMLVVAGIALDFGVQANQVFGQRAIYALGAATRSRFNGIYIGIFFFGGAAGSALAGPALVHGGWWAVTALGAGFPALAWIACMREFGRPADQ